MDALLESFSTFHTVSAKFKTYLLQHLKKDNYSKGEFLLNEGEVSYRAYFLEKGLVRCYYREGDKTITRWFLSEGDYIVSQESFLYQRPSAVFIKALENCKLWSVSYDEFKYMSKNFHEFNSIKADVALKYNKENIERQDALLNHSASERYQYLLKTRPEFIKRVPSKLLATYLGISQYTLSRIRSNR